MVSTKEFQTMLNTLDKDKQLCIMEDINSLPLSYKKEFIKDVIVDINSLYSFDKVFDYYIADCYDELKELGYITESENGVWFTIGSR